MTPCSTQTLSACKTDNSKHIHDGDTSHSQTQIVSAKACETHTGIHIHAKHTLIQSTLWEDTQVEMAHGLSLESTWSDHILVSKLFRFSTLKKLIISIKVLILIRFSLF